MIECIFTIDYEIYGNGDGSLKELIYEPAAKLIDIFLKYDVRFVPFIEVSELELIEKYAADPLIDSVKQQIRYFHHNGFELGLHLHPQWYNARHVDGTWQLDYNEYNLCTQPYQRIEQIIDQAVAFLRKVVSEPSFTPLSFRAGNWLFQPTNLIANILSKRGIKIDSSVYKGGLQYQHHLDYRPALQNGYFWSFKDDVNKPDVLGEMLEIPIYTDMVPPWRMATKKRLSLQRKTATMSKTLQEKIYKLMDMARPLQPLKFDFCRLTFEELTGIIEKLIKEDLQDSQSFKPIVAIGHTKDLIDIETVKRFLSYLKQTNINITTFGEVYEKCK